MNQLANMQDLTNRVSETIQANFGMLIPDARFKELTEKAIQDYFETDRHIQVKEIDDPTYKGDSWSKPKIKVLATPMTMFEALVYSKLEPIVLGYINEYIKKNTDSLKEAIETTLDGPEFSKAFYKGVHTASRLADLSSFYLMEEATRRLGEEIKRVEFSNRTF